VPDTFLATQLLFIIKPHNKLELAFFKEMWKRKEGVELEELELHVGNWNDRYYRGMLGDLCGVVAY